MASQPQTEEEKDLEETHIPGHGTLYVILLKETGRGLGKWTWEKGEKESRGETQRKRASVLGKEGGDRGREEGSESSVVYNFPPILLTETSSIENSLNDCIARYQNCDLMFFTEPHNERRGGLGVFKRQGVNASVVGQQQTQNYKLLVIACKPANHPENVPPLYYILVYIKPEVGNDRLERNSTTVGIETLYCRCLVWSRGGPVFILGDFNWYDFPSDVTEETTTEQYVTCPPPAMRCYGNFKNAYKSQCSPPLPSIVLTPEDQTCPHTQGVVGQMATLAI